MKKREKVFKTNRNFINKIRNAGIIIGTLTLIVSCFSNSNDESKILLDSIDSNKQVEKHVIDSTVISEHNENRDSIKAIEDEEIEEINGE